MTNFNFLSKSSSQSGSHRVVTLASTVGSPSAHRRRTMLKLLSVLVLVLTLGVGQMWGATYNLVTDVNTLSAGDKILIVSVGRSVTTKISKVNYTATYSDLAMNTTVNSNHLLGTDVSISSSSITSTTATEFTLSGNSSGWKIYNGTSYLYADARNKLTTSTEANGLAFTFSINSNTGVATITTVKNDFALNNTTNGSLVLRLYAASTAQSTANTYFVLYAPSNTQSNYDVFIYKKVPSCTPLGQINGSFFWTTHFCPAWPEKHRL